MPRTHHGQRRPNRRFIYGVSTVLLFFILFLFLRNTELAVRQIKAGLSLCGNVIIPSLFPFLVLSELLMLCGIDQCMAGVLRPPMGRLFKLSGSAGCALILGGLCGYPVSARMGASLYDKGELDGNALSFLLTFCNNASPAFLIGTVGTLLWGERQVGFMLCLIQFVSSMLMGICFSRSRPEPSAAKAGIGTPIGGFSAFPQAFVRASNAMLSVCAYVIFFSALIGILDALPRQGTAASVTKTILFGFFEISSGMKAAASLADPHLGFILSALFMGWSGLSVHGQIITVTANRGVFYRRYFGAKALQGVLCAGMAAVVCFFFSDFIPAPCTAAVLPSTFWAPVGIYIFIGFLIASLLMGILWKNQKKKIDKFA